MTSFDPTVDSHNCHCNLLYRATSSLLPLRFEALRAICAHALTISSTSEYEEEHGSATESPEPENPPAKRKRHQTLYDAIADRSRHDRFVNPNKYDKKTGKHQPTRPAPPESILASRWRQQKKYHAGNGGIDNEDENVELSRAGLSLPTAWNDALPDSVVSGIS
jgi:hypothetical protein